MLSIIKIFFLLCCYIELSAQFYTPITSIANTRFGKVRGYINNGVYTFKGIPYGKAERFRQATDPDSWEGVRNSMAYGPVCPQRGPKVTDAAEFFFQHDFGYAGEDCLRLNIWSTGINDRKKRPVMVWLHGGGYATGSGNELPSYDGENLSAKGDMVIITLNHRLNLLGFLNLSEYGADYANSANLGMFDIILSLQCIQENVTAFGGNSNNITLFGQSGGGRKVCTLLSMPEAKGLFHKAIIQSGASLELMSDSLSKSIAKNLFNEIKLTEGAIHQLSAMPYSQLLEASEKVIQRMNDDLVAQGRQVDGFQLRWGPTHDGTNIPYQLSDNRALRINPHIPIIVGSTKNEFVEAFDVPDFNPPNSMTGARMILQRKYGERTNDFISVAQAAYPAAKRPLDLLEIDIRGRRSVIQLANLRSNNANVYTYLFSWESPVLEGRFRSCHCLELPFVFNNVKKCKEMTGGEINAMQLGDHMSSAWIAFAKTSKPNHHSIPEWTPYKPASGATMIFDNTIELRNHHDRLLLETASE